MKNLLFCGMLLLSIQTFASDKGNGGSASEAQLAAYQAQLETVSLKIRSFFLKNEAELSFIFPEFNIKTLIKAIKTTDINVTNETQIDRYGKMRTCLNFSEKLLIECNYGEITPLLDQPEALFVLVLHEYLGIIGVEETSPLNASTIEGYSISKRLAPYVTKVNNYDLEINITNSVQHKILLSEEVPNVPEVQIWSDNYVRVPKTSKKLIVHLGTGAVISSVGWVLFARDPSEKEFKKIQEGDLNDEVGKKNLSMEFNYENGKIYVLRIQGEAHRPSLTIDRENPKSFNQSLKIVNNEGAVIVDSGSIPVVVNKNDPEAYYSKQAVLNYQLYLR